MNETKMSGSYASEVLHLLDEQRRSGTLCDVTVASNDNMVFNAHSAVLAASSQLFNSKLSGQNVGQVMLDLGAKNIQMLLDVLYSGISNLGPEEVIDVRLLAQSFEMVDVIKLCDGAIEYDQPRVVKPDMVDQSTNTNDISKPVPKPAKKAKFVDFDVEDDETVVEERLDMVDDPEYEPSMDMVKPRICTGRKRGRPPGKRKTDSTTTEVKSEVVDTEVLGIHVSVQENTLVDSNEPGPKTRSRSGISKLKPAVQKILTKAREPRRSYHITPSIKIAPSFKDKKGKIVQTSGIDKNPGLSTGDILLVEETLVIEDGPVCEVSLEDSFNSIVTRMKHLKDHANMKNLEADSDQFQNLVSSSFTDILKNIAQKEEASRSVSGNSVDGLNSDWKSCDYCSQFKGKKKGRLDFHEKYCSSAYKCSLCYKPFISDIDLSRHKCKKIQQESICELCGKVLVNRYALQLHMKIHLNIKKHVCQFCPKRFIRKNHLDGHVRAVHTKERPYKCTQCTARFSIKGELSRHVQKHSTESPKYACSVCGKAFYEQHQMTSHFKSCEKKHCYPVKFVCSQCGAHFSDQNQLVNHTSMCQIDASSTVTHYVEQKQNPDGSVLLCIIPEDGDGNVQRFAIPVEHDISEEHVIQIGAHDQVTLEDVLQNTQQFVQSTEIHNVIDGDQVFELQSVDNETLSYQQLTRMQDFQTLEVPIERLVSEKGEGIQVIQGVSVDTQSHVLQGVPIDAQGQNVEILEHSVPQNCDGNMMEVETVPSQQSENCLVHIQGGHIYTQSL
ncbi:zinc finger and BTB domain-containing protein 24-like [Lineus longissimus]|uniref:zinc finger and BTB domain-containing protein 24-like n=1 Tax=Lineus longissimus TaxID=88925 RepID=UPI00315D3082